MTENDEQWIPARDEQFTHIRDADPFGVSRVLLSEERSSFKWITLPNGDLVLGVFPEGDLYEEITQSGV